MNNRKANNSILVLATLGVYLGLVLVGATPQVLAQAAMARQFNVKDEIEVKDDLDKKPDDCDSLAEKAEEKGRRFPVDEASFFKYSEAFTGLSNSIQQLKGPSFSLGAYTFGDAGFPAVVAYLDSSAKPTLVSGKAQRKLDNSILALARIFPAASIDGKKGFQIDILLDGNGLVSTARVLRHNSDEAHQAYIAYSSVIDLWRCSPKNVIDALILENTEVTWKNDQIMIVTRLPRAGLDALLASDAK